MYVRDVIRFSSFNEAELQGPNPVKPYWLTLLGVTGCGKTMLAEQVFQQVMHYNPGNASLWVNGTGVYNPKRNQRPRCLWMTATEFADRIRAEHGYVETLRDDFLVAVDDIGAARDVSTFIAEGLYRLCNQRLGKWTLFTSNLSLTEMAKGIDERVASRMIRDGNVAHRIEAGDYAMRKRK